MSRRLKYHFAQSLNKSAQDRKLWETVKRHDQADMAAEKLAAFKVCCAYQFDHNPDLALHSTFRRMMNEKALTYGAAAAIAPFMVAPE